MSSEQAYDLLRKPQIAAAIAEVVEEQSKRAKLSADKVLEELMTLAFVNMDDYMRVGENGDPCIDLTATTRPRRQASWISSARTRRRGGARTPGRSARVQIKTGATRLRSRLPL